jgi:hypothetical protein
MAGQAELPQIVKTRRSPGRFAGGLDCGQEKRDQYSNDCNYDQQLD